ncbi:MAG TPA: hypothetical protein DD725_11230 [Deltaproteobacteria bacterium]|nr:hypothetical protein [Deltaproteobacteria bacterium]
MRSYDALQEAFSIRAKFMMEIKGFLISGLLTGFICAFCIPASAISEDNSHLNELLKKAEEKRLSADRYWQVLLHYKPATTGFESLIDDSQFFLSPEGKTNPKAELEATIIALFQSDKKGDEHPKCRFIARYEWLKTEISFNELLFSNITCKEYNKIAEIIQPKSVVLVFPASYMNNPASMFGHTLIRIDSSHESKLLSYAANYAAYVEDDIGFLYAFRGIFGFYKGYFKVFPYYERVKEYNDTEQRDMWEYNLNLTEKEVDRMFKHLWELKDIYSYYYFFDENCSYNLLFLLEAARPSLHLTDMAMPWVIPVDTIRTVKDSGIVENIEFRPAKATKIRHIASLLGEDSQKTALKIADQKINSDSIPTHNNEEKIMILDLAVEAVQYRYNNAELTQDEYLKLFLSILRERSKLGKSEEGYYTITAPAPPEEGHLSSRFSLGAGITDDVLFQEIRFRPAYHSLIDPDQGFVEGSQIIFADTAIRYYTDGRIKLEDFDLVDIVSLSPKSNFFNPLSWKVKTGLTQKMFQDKEEHLIYQLNPGFGLAYKNGIIGLWYILAEGDLNIGGEFKEDYAAGAGIQIGAIKKITDYWKINLSAETLFYGIREWFHENKASAVQTFTLNQSSSLNLYLSWQEIFNNEQTEIKLNWNYYF